MDNNMIEMYLGTPGSGKSLHASADIMLALKRGSLVVCNFQINTEGIKLHKNTKFAYVKNRDLNKGPDILVQEINAYFKDFGSHKILIVLDECQLLFDSRAWNLPTRPSWCYFFSQYRKIGHFNINILLVTQDEKAIDKRIVKTVEYTVFHRKISNFGIGGMILGAVFRGALFYYSVYWKPINKRASGSWMLGKKKLYNLYDTLYIFE